MPVRAVKWSLTAWSTVRPWKYRVLKFESLLYVLFTFTHRKRRYFFLPKTSNLKKICHELFTIKLCYIYYTFHVNFLGDKAVVLLGGTAGRKVSYEDNDYVHYSKDSKFSPNFAHTKNSFHHRFFGTGLMKIYLMSSIVPVLENHQKVLYHSTLFCNPMCILKDKCCEAHSQKFYLKKISFKNGDG